MSNIPNLSNMADNEWATDLFDDMLNPGSGPKAPVITNNANIDSSNPSTLNISKDVKDTSMIDFLESSIKVTDKNNYPDYSPTFKDTDDNNTNISKTDKTNDNSIDIAIDLIKSLDLIRIPDELKDTQFNEEGLKALVEETHKQKEVEFVDYMRSQIAHDPYMSDMFEYTLAGGKFADLPLMQEMTNRLIDYESVDLTDEYNQQWIVNEYLSEGLDYNKERDRAILDLIPNKIQQLTNDLVLRLEADKDKTYFIDKVNQYRQDEYNRALQARQENDIKEQEIKQKQAEWDKAFVTTLANKQWSDDKKKAIGEEVRYVKLTTGEQIPMWEYKQRVIFSNPELFQEFLDFTSKFDTKEMKFTSNAATESVKANNSNIQKIVDRLNNKQSTTNTSSNTEPATKKSKQNNSSFNPNNEYFGY